MSVVENCASHSSTGGAELGREVQQVRGPVVEALRVGVERRRRVDGVLAPVDEPERAVEAAVLEHADAPVLLQLLERVLAVGLVLSTNACSVSKPGCLGAPT